MKHKSPACEREEKPPGYRVAEIMENGARGWQIEVFNTGRVFYRVVSGYEQVVEKESDYLYLCVISKGHKNVGFKFKCTTPRVTHSVDRKRKTSIIKLLVIE